MADFPTYTPPMTYTTVLATTTPAAPFNASTPVSTAAVPIGAGQFPYENYATGVEFIVTAVDGTTPPGNTTVTFQASFDNTTWYTIPALTFTGPLPTAVGSGIGATRFRFYVQSREWRFVRLQLQCATAQTVGQESTVAVRAKLQGLQVPFTKS